MILIYYYITLFGKFVAKVYRDLKAMYFHRIRLCNLIEFTEILLRQALRLE